MECGVHIISKREGKKVRVKLLKTFLFWMCPIFCRRREYYLCHPTSRQTKIAAFPSSELLAWMGCWFMAFSLGPLHQFYARNCVFYWCKLVFNAHFPFTCFIVLCISAYTLCRYHFWDGKDSMQLLRCASLLASRDLAIRLISCIGYVMKNRHLLGLTHCLS